jgi:hypothetical protein
MSWQQAPGMLAGMDELPDRVVHIDLDLRVHGDEVAGRAAADGQPERDFSGWVGLLAALDALVEPSGGES